LILMDRLFARPSADEEKCPTQVVHHFQRDGVLGFARDNLMMTHPQHKQVGQDRNAHGLLTAVGVPADLMLANPRPDCNAQFSSSIAQRFW
jgi:hypothetical protein